MMSEEKELKARLSDVLAWFGFAYPIVLALAGMYGRDALEPLGGGRWYDLTDVIVSAMVFGACATLNYLISGKPRFIPWNKRLSLETKDDMKRLAIRSAIAFSVLGIFAIARILGVKPF